MNLEKKNQYLEKKIGKNATIHEPEKNSIADLDIDV